MDIATARMERPPPNFNPMQSAQSAEGEKEKEKARIMGFAGQRRAEEGKTKPARVNEQGDLPLWIQQFPPQVIGVQLVSHLLRTCSWSKELGCLSLTGSDTKEYQ